MDHQASFALAKKYLNFECNEELAEFIYYKLRKVKKKFSHQTGALRKEDEPNSVENQSSLSGKDISREPVHEMTPNSAASHRQETEGIELRENPHGRRCTEQKILVGQEQVLVTPMLQHNIGSLKDELLKKRVDLIHKICSRRADELMAKQQLEISDFNIHKEEEKMKLKKTHVLDLELIRAIHTDSTVRNDKIRLLTQEFSKKMESETLPQNVFGHMVGSTSHEFDSYLLICLPTFKDTGSAACGLRKVLQQELSKGSRG